MPVQSSKDKVEKDPQLEAREAYIDMDHHVLGRHRQQNTPFRMSHSETSVRSPAPLIGQHNVQVLEELMGYSHSELLDAYGNGVLWPKGMPKEPYIEELLR